MGDFDETSGDAWPWMAAINQNLLEENLAEAKRLSEAALAAESTEDGRAAAHRAIAIVAIIRGDAELAQTASEAALSIMSTFDDRRAEAAGIHLVGRARLSAHLFEDAKTSVFEALAIFRDLEDAVGEASVLNTIARLHLAQHEHHDASRHSSFDLGSLPTMSSQVPRRVCTLFSMPNWAKSGVIVGRSEARISSVLVASNSFEAPVFFFTRRVDVSDEGILPRRTADEALAIFRKLGEKQGQVSVLQTIFDIMCTKFGSAPEALKASQSMVAIFRDDDDLVGEASALLVGCRADVAAGLFQRAASTAQEVARFFNAAGLRIKEAAAILVAADVAFAEGAVWEGLKVGSQALELYTTLGISSGKSLALISLAGGHLEMGEYDVAVARAGEAAVFARQTRHKKLEATALRTLALAHLAKLGAMSDDAAACKEAQAALTASRSSWKIYQLLDDTSSGDFASTLQVFASSLFACSELEKALQRASTAKEIFHSLENSGGEAACWCVLAKVYWAKEDRDAALEAALHAQSLFQEVKDKVGLRSTASLIDSIEGRQRSTEVAPALLQTSFGEFKEVDIDFAKFGAQEIARYDGLEGRQARTATDKRTGQKTIGNAENTGFDRGVEVAKKRHPQSDFTIRKLH